MNFSNLCGADYSYILQFIHTLLDVFYCVYLFVFSSEYDFYFALFIFIVAVQWVFNKNECSFSYLEKKWLDPSYVFGSDPKKIPHYETFHTPMTVSITHYMHVINMFIIIWRTDSWLTRIVALLGVAIGYYQMYIVKYDKDVVDKDLEKELEKDIESPPSEFESQDVNGNVELVIDEESDQVLEQIVERPVDKDFDEVFETIKSTF